MQGHTPVGTQVYWASQYSALSKDILGFPSSGNMSKLEHDLSDLASPFLCILWSELTKYNGASWHHVSCERDTQTWWVTVKTGAAEGLCPLNQWPGAL